MTDLQVIDHWCQKQIGALNEVMEPYILAGGDLDDPQYRQQLGQHQAFMRMRSYLSSARKLGL